MSTATSSRWNTSVPTASSPTTTARTKTSIITLSSLFNSRPCRCLIEFPGRWLTTRRSRGSTISGPSLSSKTSANSSTSCSSSSPTNTSRYPLSSKPIKRNELKDIHIDDSEDIDKNRLNDSGFSINEQNLQRLYHSFYKAISKMNKVRSFHHRTSNRTTQRLQPNCGRWPRTSWNWKRSKLKFTDWPTRNSRPNR